MISKQRSIEDQQADIFFDLEEIIVANRPFSLRDYEEETEVTTDIVQEVSLPVYYNVGSRTLSLLNEF